MVGHCSDRGLCSHTALVVTSCLKERCWVLARSETDARLKLTLVTGIAVPLRPGKRFPTSPWIDRNLTAFTLEDPSNREVPAGVIVTVPIYRRRVRFCSLAREARTECE